MLDQVDNELDEALRAGTLPPEIASAIEESQHRGQRPDEKEAHTERQTPSWAMGGAHAGNGGNDSRGEAGGTTVDVNETDPEPVVSYRVSSRVFPPENRGLREKTEELAVNDELPLPAGHEEWKRKRMQESDSPTLQMVATSPGLNAVHFDPYTSPGAQRKHAGVGLALVNTGQGSALSMVVHKMIAGGPAAESNDISIGDPLLPCRAAKRRRQYAESTIITDTPCQVIGSSLSMADKSRS
jgi:hypothetical protein